MSEENMTPEQKTLLEPFGAVLHNWDQQLAEMTPEEFAEIEMACKVVSMTNCWCCTFEAAQILQRRITERRERERHDTTAPGVK
jgi:hypothetical protein